MTRRMQLWVLLPTMLGLAIFITILWYLRSPGRGLPYRDSFAQQEMDEWIPYSGTWNIANGAIENTSNDRGAKLITGSSFWRNYSLEADLQLLGSAGDAGLILRASDIESGVDSYNGYYAGLRTTDGMLVLGRAEHGWIEYPPAKMPGGVVPGKWYHLKFTVYGCSLSATASEEGTNNRQTTVIRDPSCFVSGKVGLRSMASGGTWRNVQVENVSPADIAQLSAANLPANVAIYPTNQGFASAAAQSAVPAPIAPDKTSLPVQSIQSLRLLSTTRPVRTAVSGSIIQTHPLYIQDSSGGALVELETPVSLQVGDEVEVEGDIYPQGLTVAIRRARIKTFSALAPRPPLSVTADQAATGMYHAMFIEVEGNLYGQAASSDGPVLELKDGQQIFRAVAHSEATAQYFKKLQINSLLRLRGICLADSSNTQNEVPFLLLINSPEDVKVLLGPPWWSVKNLTLLAITMLALGFGVHLIYSRAEEWRLRAVIDERERLAHEIHDTLAQSFAGIGFQLRAIRNRISKNHTPLDGEALLRELNQASELVRHSHDEARRSIITLRPDATEAGGLIVALGEIARQMAGPAPVTIETAVKGEVSFIPLRTLDCLFRIGQESIANAMQHGHPQKIGIVATYSASSITLVIEDDGTGFTPGMGIAGFGLTGIQRRAESIDGTSAIESTPGKGTRVVVTAPLIRNRYRLWRLAYDDDQEPHTHA